MALFQFKWLRKFVRRNTKPIPEYEAGVWKQRLSIVYALLAWNAFGYVCYMAYTGRNDWAKYYGVKTEEEANMSPAQHYAKTLNIPKAKVLRFRGVEKQQEYEFDERKESSQLPEE